MKPDWLDTSEYPFESHYLQLPAGNMHYIDEGEGDVMVMIHGTPSWSFLFRNLIKQFRSRYRCIALDHIGFGLSDKPADWSYKPEEHAANFERLVEHLQLKNITLIVHDFGAPIGLAYAIKHPENVKSIVMLNTWMWSLASQQKPTKASKSLIGPLGKFLHKNLNITGRGLFEEAFGDSGKMNQKLLDQYVKALGNPGEQVRSWSCARELVGTSQWYETLWAQREKIKDIPTLILWGVKDKFILPDALHKWKRFFHECYVIQFEESGHFLLEENADELGSYIDNFVREELKHAHQA